MSYNRLMASIHFMNYHYFLIIFLVFKTIPESSLIRSQYIPEEGREGVIV